MSYLKQRVFSALRRTVLGEYAQGVIYRTSNGLLAAAVDDVIVGRSLGFKGAYDTPEIDHLSGLLSKQDVVYVVGTHIGALLVPLAGACREIVGYEANPETFAYLRTNVHLNDVRNARVFNLAAGDAARTIEFYQNRSNSGGSKIKPLKDRHFYTYDSPKTIVVPMVSLDQHIAAERLPPPNAIIMDIEGAEYLALKGMPATLAGARLLYIEYVPHHLENVSGVTNTQFFDLILPHYRTVRFMHTHAGTIDLSANAAEFRTVVDGLWQRGRGDDLLFLRS